MSAARLDERETGARELSHRLEGMQRQLAEAEQVLAAERARVHRTEGEMQHRIGELEKRTAAVEFGLESERTARERAEQLLEGMREGQRQVAVLVGEMRAIVERVIADARAADSAPSPEPRPPQEILARSAASRPAADDEHAQERGAEMAQALAAAVERLRERADSVPEPEPEEPEERRQTPERRAARIPSHKHSMSLIGRIRLRRKQRRAALRLRRSGA